MKWISLILLCLIISGCDNDPRVIETALGVFVLIENKNKDTIYRCEVLVDEVD